MDNCYRKKYYLRQLAIALFTLMVMACQQSPQEKLQLGEERAANNEAQTTAEMIELIGAISLQRHPTGEIKRFNQSKSLGCFDATFAVLKDLPDELRQGIFTTPQSYTAKLRFANATETDDTKKDFRGMSIKLFNAPGSAMWGKSGQQDFILNSYPALFAANPEDFLAFIKATKDDKVWKYFIRPSHFYSLKVVLKGRQKIDNPFAIRYWSTTPYRFGSDTSKAVKYSVKTCSEPFKNTTEPHRNVLTETMAQHLQKKPVCFDFMVQFQKDPESMPIEDASVIWDEVRSPFKKVATITIHNQSFTTDKNTSQCETMSFNPWQSVEEHKPLGGINRVRKPVYSETAAFRVRENKRRQSN